MPTPSRPASSQRAMNEARSGSGRPTGTRRATRRAVIHASYTLQGCWQELEGSAASQDVVSVRVGCPNCSEQPWSAPRQLRLFRAFLSAKQPDGQDSVCMRTSVIGRWGEPMATFMERVVPVVDETIRALARTKFIEDPIAGPRHLEIQASLAQPTSDTVASSRLRLRESLKESNRHKVWQDDKFRVSRAADALVGAQSEEQCRHSELPYGDSVRTVQVDMVAFDHADV